MHCPDTGGTCFDLDCQTLGCQGDSIRRQLNQTNVDGRELPHPIPRVMVSLPPREMMSRVYSRAMSIFFAKKAA